MQAKAALDWVLSVMKPEDYLIVLNVLNLKAPSSPGWSALFVAYTHDIVRNEVMKRESSEKLEEIAKRIKDLGFRFYETCCVRGEPAKISFLFKTLAFLTQRGVQLRCREEDRYDCDGKTRNLEC